MATALELGLKQGNIVTAVTSYTIKDGGMRGVPIGHPDAIIEATVAEVLGVGEDGTTNVKILASTNLHEKIGKTNHWWGGFRNYVGHGLERVNRELVAAGYIIDTKRDKAGNIAGVEVLNIRQG